MAKYSNLIAAIKAVVKTNGAQEITGQNLQTTLTTMVDKLGAGFQYGGVVAPTDTFDSARWGDVRVAFLACIAGTYTNYGGFTLTEGQVAVITYDGTWMLNVIYANSQIY